MKRTVKKPEERRSELIACAQKLFFSEGYESTSVRDIVDEVGVAKGTFYYYFESKRAILEALVTDLATQRRVLFREIVADESLNATEKWTRAVREIGDWKLERKAGLLNILRAMQKDENVLLQHRLMTRAAQTAAPEMAKIIAQGVEEGVFETAYLAESAELVYVVRMAFADSLADIFLSPETYEDPVALVRRKVAAMQAAIERILGAAPGSLPLIGDEAVAAWFTS